MGLDRRSFTFGAGDPDGIVAEMRTMAANADGRKWLNISPDINADDVHTGSLFWRLLSSRGPVVPKLTWVPAYETKGQRQHCEVGLIHATGRNAVERLRASGVTIPKGWVLDQDHTKRGIILAVPPAVDPAVIVTFGLAALPHLSPFAFEPYYEATFFSRSGTDEK